MRHIRVQSDSPDVMIESLQQAFIKAPAIILVDCRDICESDEFPVFEERVVEQIPEGTSWRYEELQNGVMILTNRREMNAGERYQRYSEQQKIDIAVSLAVELGMRAVQPYGRRLISVI